MTIVTPLSICLAVVCAFLLGSHQHLCDNRNKALKAEELLDKLNEK